MDSGDTRFFMAKRKLHPLSIGFLVGVCILTAEMLAGADLTTKSGKVYRDYSVTDVTQLGVTVIFADGAAAIPLPELPDDLREKYSTEWTRKQMIARQRADALLDKERGKEAEPVAAIRSKLQSAQKQAKTITVCGKDGRRYEKCRIQHVAPDGVTLKIDGVPTHIPFRKIVILSDGELSAPTFLANPPEVPVRGPHGASKTPPASPPPKTYIGPRGGVYYYNQNGRKVYLRKDEPAPQENREAK